MSILRDLEELGLTESEAKLYVAALKLGPSTVNELQQETRLHRTNIYDFAQKLSNKGLMTKYQQDNVTTYAAADSKKILAYLETKKALAQDLVTQLQSIQNTQDPEIRVEVFRGREGIKHFLTDIIVEKKDYISMGINEEDWLQHYPILTQQHFTKEQEAKLNVRVLTSDQASLTHGHITYRYVSQEYFNPTPITVYGDKVCMLIWQPTTVIIITNPQLAQTYKKNFELLWDVADKKRTSQ